MIMKATVLAVFGLLAMSLTLPASADSPQQWIVTTEQPGINPCTGDDIFLEAEVLFSEHVHQNTSLTHARLLASIGAQQTQMAVLHILENPNGLIAWIREIHDAPDGSKFKVTIVNVLRNGSDLQFSFDALCIRGPAL